MNKGLKLFVITLVAGYVAAGKPIYRFPPEKSEGIIESLIKCVADKGFDSTIMDEIKKGNYIENDKTAEVIYCAHKNLGYELENGTFKVDKVMTELFPDKPEARKVIEDCNKDSGTGPVGNLKAIFSCFAEKAPFKVMV